MASSRFLGFDLKGWRVAGAGGFRQLPGNVVESYGGPGLFWYAPEKFEDFRLCIEWRIASVEDNSGVFLRIPFLFNSPQPGIDRGYEVQIDDRGVDPDKRVLGSRLHLTGAIYGLAPAARRCSRPLGAWNLFDITARGPTITVDLNGQEVSSLQNASREPQGHIGLQSHHEGSAVQFRNLAVVVF
jgi:3-keto-disaccharide hydrolase